MTKKSEATPYIVACLIALTFFAIVETIEPYYFLQDDNRDIFLPFYLHNYRAALDGQLAQYNFFQSLGKPHFATGQVAALHPVPYLSIFLSKLLLGHVFGSVEILMLIYLLLGASGFVFLIRRLGYSGAAGVFAATAWCLNPFNILTAMSWTTYGPMIGLMPWTTASIVLVFERRLRSGVPLFIASHLAIFYVGAPQFFLYTAIIDACLLSWLLISTARAHAERRKELAGTIGIFAGLTIFVSALCVPLLLPMWAHTQLSAFRQSAKSFDALLICRFSFEQLFNGLFVPHIRFYKPLGWEWCQTYFPPEFLHQGFLATLMLIAYPFVRRREPLERRRAIDASYFTGIALVLGSLGLLTFIIYLVPVMNRFRWPFKFFGFGNFLLLIATAPVFDALVARLKKSAARLALMTALIGGMFVNLVLLDTSFTQQGFLEHFDSVPLDEPLIPRLHDTRTVSVGCRSYPGRDPMVFTISTMGYDYATLWELHFFGGYDPLVPELNHKLTLHLDYSSALCGPAETIPLGHLRRWGVQHYILNHPLSDQYEPFLRKHGLRRVAADGERVVMFDPRAAPLVSGRNCRLQKVGRVGDDFTATVACRADDVVTMRFLYSPEFSATVDGQPTPIEETDVNQVAIRVPAGVHEIQLAFDDPLIDIGFSIALFALACGAAVLVVIVRRRQAKSAA